MNHRYYFGIEIDDGLGCFGEFNKKNFLCKKHCVLRLKCAIEQNHNLQMEILEDLVITQDEATKIQ
jgi:hypothetical protein